MFFGWQRDAPASDTGDALEESAPLAFLQAAAEKTPSRSGTIGECRTSPIPVTDGLEPYPT